jgi:uncharacterized glyoxalase superfamily protein PhnB
MGLNDGPAFPTFRRRTLMLVNRSIPQTTVIPELAYPDVRRAAAWLCDAFGFSVRIFIGNHRVQINVGDGAMVVTEQKTTGPQRNSGISVMVRVPDVDEHHERARRHGAVILRPPQDYPYGERQYSAEDVNGYIWTFSESIADVQPEDWGGESVQL